MKEWIDRRFKEAEKNVKDAMVGLNLIVADLFQMCGADEMHYSIEDNDDTIAYFAHN